MLEVWFCCYVKMLGVATEFIIKMQYQLWFYITFTYGQNIQQFIFVIISTSLLFHFACKNKTYGEGNSYNASISMF